MNGEQEEREFGVLYRFVHYREPFYNVTAGLRVESEREKKAKNGDVAGRQVRPRICSCGCFLHGVSQPILLTDGTRPNRTPLQ